MMSENEPIPTYMKVGGAVVVLLFFLSFLSAELPVVIIFYALPILRQFPLDLAFFGKLFR